ncbi:MAG: cysteine desulfurase family protein [Candidatus Liptonbacteria bacterium]|nr:cysteine desulfurase family protein [Candidatus Liptonbacteria bacterium]
MKKIYLDYAASTPVAPEVEAVMRPYFLNKFGNAGSLHSFGQEAIAALDESRETIANAIGAGFREIIFTGSATESNNLALRGSIRGFTQTIRRNTRKKFSVSPREVRVSPRPRLVISAIEHESILETARELERKGVEVIYIPVSKKGIVDLEKLKESLNERTVLVSVMYANNEIGTIQPLFEIKKIISDFKKRKSQIQNSKSETNFKSQISNHKKVSELEFQISDLETAYPLFHTDAVQAFQFLDCDVKKLGVDLMTLSGHKIYGPKGVGALYIRSTKHEARNQKQILNIKYQIPNKNVSNFKFQISNLQQLVSPIVVGGGQEFGLRSGTENIPLIVGFAEAVRLIAKNREKEGERIAKLRDYLWKGIKKIYPKIERNGDTEKVLPNFLNVYFPDYKAEDLLVRLDLAGIAVSTGSACSARSAEPSYVIEALGLKGEQSSRSIRITLGRQTSKRDIDTFLKIMKNITKG